jgi:hypothetical protein
MEQCSIVDCERLRKYLDTGWCQTHYHRYWRTGTVELLPRTTRTDLTYFGAHGRVKSVFGSATKYCCVFCGGKANEWAYDGTDESELNGFVTDNKWPVTYSVWPEFYMPLCHPCHRKMDASARALRRTHCVNGHEMTPENTYTRPSKPNNRECVTCRAESSKLRYASKKG